MGVPFRIVLYAENEMRAENASNAAFGRISELNNILSDYDYDSELSRLSHTAGSGTRVKVSEDLWTVLSTAQSFAEESNGAFDVTIGPVVNLWRKTRRDKTFPEKTRLAEARKAVGYQYVLLDPATRSVELKVSNMRLDLGAIAKGYAIDEAMKILKTAGIPSALVSGGGDMAVSQSPPGKDGWKIELPVETDASAPSGYLLLKNQAMATSGDLFQFVELEGKRYSHIVDPRTGVGLINQRRVVIVAQDCMTADALSTSVSVLGLNEGLKLARKFPGTTVRVAETSNHKSPPLPTNSIIPISPPKKKTPERR